MNGNPNDKTFLYQVKQLFKNFPIILHPQQHTPSCEIVLTPELLWILRKKETSVAGETILTCLHEKRWP